MKIELVDKRILDDKYPEFKIPAYQTDGSAGMDVQACVRDDIIIQPSKIVTIDTGIRLDMTDAPNMAALLMIRSSLGKKGLCLANPVGLIDNDYLGVVKTMIRNDSGKIQVIKPADRIAQLLFIPFVKVRPVFGKIDTNKTDRGEGGFGSTNKV